MPAFCVVFTAFWKGAMSSILISDIEKGQADITVLKMKTHLTERHQLHSEIIKTVVTL